MVVPELALTRLERREFPALGLVGCYNPASIVQFACLDFVCVDPPLDGPVARVFFFEADSGELRFFLAPCSGDGFACNASRKADDPIPVTDSKLIGCSGGRGRDTALPESTTLEIVICHCSLPAQAFRPQTQADANSSRFFC